MTSTTHWIKAFEKFDIKPASWKRFRKRYPWHIDRTACKMKFGNSSPFSLFFKRKFWNSDLYICLSTMFHPYRTYFDILSRQWLAELFSVLFLDINLFPRSLSNSATFLQSLCGSLDNTNISREESINHVASNKTINFLWFFWWFCNTYRSHFLNHSLGWFRDDFTAMGEAVARAVDEILENQFSRLIMKLKAYRCPTQSRLCIWRIWWCRALERALMIYQNINENNKRLNSFGGQRSIRQINWLISERLTQRF